MGVIVNARMISRSRVIANIIIRMTGMMGAIKTTAIPGVIGMATIGMISEAMDATTIAETMAIIPVGTTTTTADAT